MQAIAEQNALERDAAEREAREKETRVLSLTRELDDLMEKVEELERSKRQLAAELDELTNNQGTADKNVSSILFGFITVRNNTFWCVLLSGYDCVVEVRTV